MGCSRRGEDPSREYCGTGDNWPFALFMMIRRANPRPVGILTPIKNRPLVPGCGICGTLKPPASNPNPPSVIFLPIQCSRAVTPFDPCSFLVTLASEVAFPSVSPSLHEPSSCAGCIIASTSGSLASSHSEADFVVTEHGHERTAVSGHVACHTPLFTRSTSLAAYSFSFRVPPAISY